MGSIVDDYREPLSKPAEKKDFDLTEGKNFDVTFKTPPVYVQIDPAASIAVNADPNQGIYATAPGTCSGQAMSTAPMPCYINPAELANMVYMWGDNNLMLKSRGVNQHNWEAEITFVLIPQGVEYVVSYSTAMEALRTYGLNCWLTRPSAWPGQRTP